MDTDKLLSSESIEFKSKNRNIIFIIVTIILSILCIIFIALYASEKNKDSDEEKKSDTYVPLKSWNEKESKQKLIQFIEKINSKEHFVPNEARIAVFDLDGTLFQETDPVYNDCKLFCHRVLNDSTYTASIEDIETCEQLIPSLNVSSLFDEVTLNISLRYGEVFKDLTLEQYYDYIKNYMSKPAEGYDNLKRGDAFYKPMLEVIEYLQKNDFNIFICSGTDRFQVRVVIEGHIDIPKSNVIGSDYRIKATNQGDKTGNNYDYRLDDDFNFDGEFLAKNLKTNKIINIIKEIGNKPILSFGNSGGDSSMANYVIHNNTYPSEAFMLLCDDTDRENGNKDKANDMKVKCSKAGWIPISMKDDWKTIYGDNVNKK